MLIVKCQETRVLILLTQAKYQDKGSGQGENRVWVREGRLVLFIVVQGERRPPGPGFPTNLPSVSVSNPADFSDFYFYLSLFPCLCFYLCLLFSPTSVYIYKSLWLSSLHPLHQSVSGVSITYIQHISIRCTRFCMHNPDLNLAKWSLWTKATRNLESKHSLPGHMDLPRPFLHRSTSPSHLLASWLILRWAPLKGIVNCNCEGKNINPRPYCAFWYRQCCFISDYCKSLDVLF